MTRALAMAAFAVADAGGARALRGVRPIGLPRARVSSIDVAVNIVHSDDGRVLLAERTARQIAAGFWELPGGKIELGETPSEAAARELAEEIGITAHALRPWIVYDHAFTRKRVRLHLFRVDRWTGTPHGREGQRLAWVDPALPHVGPVLASNDRALTALGLPADFVITPGGDIGLARLFLTALPDMLARGMRLVAVCEPQLTADQRVAFARRVVEVARPYQAQVLLTGSVLQARRAGVTGLFSTPLDFYRFMARPPVRLWAVACKDVDDVNRAIALGADVAVLNADLASDRNGRPRIESDRLERLASTVPISVYAPGAVPATPPQRAGATGILVHRISERTTQNVS